MICSCCDKHRRGLVERDPKLNGIDFINVSGEHELSVHFIKKVHHELGVENFRIAGGDRVRNIKVTSATRDPKGATNILILGVSEPGDFANYTLRLVDPAHPENPPPEYDP